MILIEVDFRIARSGDIDEVVQKIVCSLPLNELGFLSLASVKLPRRFRCWWIEASRKLHVAFR